MAQSDLKIMNGWIPPGIHGVIDYLIDQGLGEVQHVVTGPRPLLLAYAAQNGIETTVLEKGLDVTTDYGNGLFQARFSHAQANGTVFVAQHPLGSTDITTQLYEFRS